MVKSFRLFVIRGQEIMFFYLSESFIIGNSSSIELSFYQIIEGRPRLGISHCLPNALIYYCNKKKWQ